MSIDNRIGQRISSENDRNGRHRKLATSPEHHEVPCIRDAPAGIRDARPAFVMLARHSLMLARHSLTPGIGDALPGLAGHSVTLCQHGLKRRLRHYH